MTQRRKLSSEFKAQVALEAIKGTKTLAELAQEPHDTATNPILYFFYPISTIHRNLFWSKP